LAKKVTQIMAKRKSLDNKTLQQIAAQDANKTPEDRLADLFTLEEIVNMNPSYKSFLLDKFRYQIFIEKSILDEGKGGEFWLELSDLTKQFRGIGIGD
ncbi:MAG: hypothetical protein AAFV80_09820, partial [Bacteroidota bacterium]